VIPFFQPSPSDPFSPGKVFTFLLVTIGPLKVIGPFAKMTAGWDRGLKRRLAFQAITIAAIGAFAAATVGSQLLKNWGISLGALGSVMGRLGLLDEARRAFASGAELLQESSDPLELAKLLCAHARLELDGGDRTRALALAGEAERLAGEVGPSESSALSGEIAALRERI